MTTKSDETRDLLLQTAIRLLMEGESVFTLDAVVKRAGVSKGGLMHHFPSKEALIEGIVAEIISQYAASASSVSHSAEIGSEEETKAYVETSLEPSKRAATVDMARGMIRLYGSDFRKDTPFLAPWRKMFASRLDHFRENSDLDGFSKAAVITLVVESFILLDVFNLYEFTPRELDGIKAELLKRFQ